MTTSKNTSLHHTRPRPARGAVLRAAPWVAGGWALTFLALSVLALIGRTSAPWSPTPASVLGGSGVEQVTWLIVAVAVAVLAAKAVAVGSRSPRMLRVAGWLLVVLGVGVSVVLSDTRALAFLGYLPMLLLAVVGIGPAAGHLEWSLLTDSAAALGHAVGGPAIAVTGVLTLARAAELTGAGPLGWHGWARFGRPAVLVAVCVPLTYAVTRVAWAAGVPWGLSAETLAGLGSARYAGLGLALFCLLGVWLTTGLVARWGETFWTWVPHIGGRPVPPALALVPGLLVAGAVTSAGLSFWRLVLAGELTEAPGAVSDWAVWGPALLWPLWGAALAVGCLAYLGRVRAGADQGRR